MSQPVYGNLYQFTSMGGQMSLPVHQYLLAGEPSVMFATGSYDQAEWILPQIRDILKGRPLDYLFISHMESDECGGIALFLKKFPHLKVISSAFTANELRGYGFKPQIVNADEGDVLDLGNVQLKFFRYPAEVHLHDGLLVYELNSGIFYSSDLMFHHISNGAKVIESEWKSEVGSIDGNRIIDSARREKLKDDLIRIMPKFIAVGHGSCSRTV